MLPTPPRVWFLAQLEWHQDMVEPQWLVLDSQEHQCQLDMAQPQLDMAQLQLDMVQPQLAMVHQPLDTPLDTVCQSLVPLSLPFLPLPSLPLSPPPV